MPQEHSNNYATCSCGGLVNSLRQKELYVHVGICHQLQGGHQGCQVPLGGTRVIPTEVIIDPFDGVKSVHSGRRGAQRDAGRIGQTPQRTRWTGLAHRRPVFRVRRTSLCSTCGHKDQGVKHAQSNMGSLEPVKLLCRFGGDQDDFWLKNQKSS